MERIRLKRRRRGMGHVDISICDMPALKRYKQYYGVDVPALAARAADGVYVPCPPRLPPEDNDNEYEYDYDYDEAPLEGEEVGLLMGYEPKSRTRVRKPGSKRRKLALPIPTGPTQVVESAAEAPTTAEAPATAEGPATTTVAAAATTTVAAAATTTTTATTTGAEKESVVEMDTTPTTLTLTPAPGASKESGGLPLATKTAEFETGRDVHAAKLLLKLPDPSSREFITKHMTPYLWTDVNLEKVLDVIPTHPTPTPPTLPLPPTPPTQPTLPPAKSANAVVEMAIEPTRATPANPANPANPAQGAQGEEDEEKLVAAVNYHFRHAQMPDEFDTLRRFSRIVRIRSTREAIRQAKAIRREQEALAQDPTSSTTSTSTSTSTTTTTTTTEPLPNPPSNPKS